jgi:chaperonin GroES
MNIKPLGDRVVVKPSPAEEKTKGGIILPDTAKEKPVIGEILAVGPGRRADDGKLVPLDLKIGDKVLYGKYSGTEVSLNGAEVLIMREADIFGVV